MSKQPEELRYAAQLVIDTWRGGGVSVGEREANMNAAIRYLASTMGRGMATEAPSVPVEIPVGQDAVLMGEATRIIVAGGPKTGKTTLATRLAKSLSVAPRCTDEAMDLGWSESSAAVATWFAAEEFVIEGVACARALRKWLAANPDGKPCDKLYMLTIPHAELTNGQSAMAKGIATVFAEIQWQLIDRGVEIFGDEAVPDESPQV